MQRAYRCYGYWGATAKQQHIEENYPGLLTKRPYEKKIKPIGQNDATQTTSKQLDLATVMQVSQAISSEIMLDQLLKKTLQLSITNAGAQRGCLIRSNNGELTVEVVEDLDQADQNINLPQPLSQCRSLCRAIVHFVSRSLESVILANAAKEGSFVNDGYIVANQCKSILCMPILNKGQLSGILYMENNLTDNAFTAGRLEILSIIAAQTAISNRFYSQYFSRSLFH